MKTEIIPYKYGYWRLVTRAERNYGYKGRIIANISLSFFLSFFPVVLLGFPLGLLGTGIFWLWMFLSEWGDVETTTSQLNGEKK